ncbi:MAG: hydrolase [Haliangiales bacterium]
MSTVVRCALTETKNVYPMPERVAALGGLADHLDDIRAANVAHHLDLIAAASDRGVGVIGLGELFPAPYFALGRDPMWHALAEDARTGPTVSALSAAASDHSMIIIAPIYELCAQSGQRFNTAVVIDERGEVLGCYRKSHIPRGENEQGSFDEPFYYDRSDGNAYAGTTNISNNRFFPVFETTRGRIGVATCYDRHFDGVMRTLAIQGAELVFSPAVTFGDKSERMWALEFPVDAARYNLFIGGSNRRGSEAPWHQEYFGGSYFCGPNGRLPCVSDHPHLIISDVDLAVLREPDRSGWDLPRDRRPTIYD